MPDPVPLSASVTIDAGFAARAARANTRMVLLRGPSLWAGGALVLVGLGLAALDSPATAGIAVALGAALVVGLPLLLLVGGRRSISRQLPVGAVLQTGFGAEAFSTSGPAGSSTLLYSAFSNARRDGEFVFLRTRATRRWSLFPGSLFNDADLARFARSSDPTAAQPGTRP